MFSVGACAPSRSGNVSYTFSSKLLYVEIDISSHTMTVTSNSALNPESDNPDLSNSVALERSPHLIMLLHTPKGALSLPLPLPPRLTPPDHRLIVTSATPGRGIFAARPIPAHATLDVCPVLVLSPEDNEHHIRHTQLHHYT